MLKYVIAAGALALSSHAMAGPTYQFTDNNANTGGAGDYLDSLSTTWDAGRELLKWQTTFANSEVDSFWLVINDRANPKQSNANELVIMYGDLEAGIVTSYVYNGLNSANSYGNPGIYLQTDALTVNGNSIEFTIDATDINAANITDPDPNDNVESIYQGIIAGPDSIGIWFHAAINSTFTYNGDEITNYGFGAQAWYDRANLPMESVPEPGTLASLGLGLLSVIAIRGRRKRYHAALVGR
ncbi:MAG: PEP-CTERM sorting domain-containing protein [Pseudomonadales bacterium]